MVINVHYVEQQYALTRLALWTGEVSYLLVQDLAFVRQHDLWIKALIKVNA